VIAFIASTPICICRHRALENSFPKPTSSISTRLPQSYPTMSAASHLPKLVAHYLATDYPSVLPHFLEAARVPSPDLSSPPSPDLRTLLQDYLSYRVAEDLKHVAIEEREEPAQDGSWRGWGLQDLMRVEMKPEVKLEGAKRSIEGVSASNLLTVQAQRVPKREFDLGSAS